MENDSKSRSSNCNKKLDITNHNPLQEASTTSSWKLEKAVEVKVEMKSETHETPSAKEYQWNPLLSISLLCHFEVVFFHKLEKLSDFLWFGDARPSAHNSDTTQLHVKVFPSHTGDWYRIAKRRHFKGYRQKMEQSGFFRYTVTAPGSDQP